MTTIHGSLIKTEHDYNLQHVLVMKYVGARYENHTTFYDSLEDRIDLKAETPQQK